MKKAIFTLFCVCFSVTILFGQKTGVFTWPFYFTNTSGTATQQRSISFNVPGNYNVVNKYKLFICLPGQGGDPESFISDESFGNTQFFLNGNFGPHVILVSPSDGGGSTSYFYPPGEDDGIIDRTIEVVKNFYNIDDDQIYLMGFSFGGKSAYMIGLQSQEKFRGLILSTPGIQTNAEVNNGTYIKYNYANAPYIPACFIVGTNDPFGYAQTVPYSSSVFTNNGGTGKLIQVQGLSHLLAAETQIQQCYQFTEANAGLAPSLDASIHKIVGPFYTCNNSFSPTVTLKNAGKTPLTSAIISYKVDGGAPQTYSWTGNLAQNAIQDLVLPTTTVSAGNHTLEVCTSAPNSATDNYLINDCKTTSFVVSSQGASLPFSEGFESVFPPVGWLISNPDHFLTWEKTNKAAKTGTGSITVKDFDYNNNGQLDELTMPPLNLNGVSNLSFDVAYRQYAAGGTATLEVLIADGCGSSFTSIYKKTGSGLQTANTDTNEFIPTANQWRNESLSLAAYSTYQNAIIKFRFKQDFENNIYVDNIKIGGIPQAVHNISWKEYIKIAPNPSPGKFIVTSDYLSDHQLTITVQNIMGQVIQTGTLNNVNRMVPVDIGTEPNGIYFVTVTGDNSSFTTKVILSK